GKEQHITITSSTNMSKEDIEKAVKEAEKFAEEDKKQKEAVEVKNHAENAIFQMEKSMNELGDKITDEDKAPVNAAIEKLKETVKGGDVAAIKADTEALEKAFYPIAEKLYKEQQAAGADGAANNGQAGTDGDGNYYGADFEDKT
ncbi:MAG: Hsp70 family protein, partial [Clostridia bacterium]|nr:Hsp70 family protein [Clostridia bacterium]